jgi:hypothetical protein
VKYEIQTAPDGKIIRVTKDEDSLERNQAVQQ